MRYCIGVYGVCSAEYKIGLPGTRERPIPMCLITNPKAKQLKTLIQYKYIILVNTQVCYRYCLSFPTHPHDYKYQDVNYSVNKIVCARNVNI